MTRTITGLSVSEFLLAIMLPGMLAAAPLRAGADAVPKPGAAAPAEDAAVSRRPAAQVEGQGAIRSGPDAAAAAAAIAAAEEAERDARALELNAAQALNDALSRTGESGQMEKKPASGAAGGRAEASGKADGARRGAEDAELKAPGAKWETDRLRVIHSMARSAAASAAADLQLAKVKYASVAGGAVSDPEKTGGKHTGTGIAAGLVNGPEARETPAASPTPAAPAEAVVFPFPSSTPSPPPLTLNETALVALGACFLSSVAGAVFWFIQRKALREADSRMADRFEGLGTDLAEIERQLAAHAGPQKSAVHAQRQNALTLQPPSAGLPSHAMLAMAATVPLEEGGWRKICQDSLGLLELIHSGRAMVGVLPNELSDFPAHQDVAWRMLDRSRSQRADASCRTAWTVRMRDAMVSGLLHDPELPAFSEGKENPEHHFRRRFIRDVLSPELSPLLIAMEEMRHLNAFLPDAEIHPDLSAHARGLEEAIRELLLRCRRDFGFEIEYVPLLAVCDFRSLKNTRNGDPARLPDYYQELKCDDKAVRGILRYGNQSTGLTPDSPTEIVYSP